MHSHRILVSPLHAWPICMSCSWGFFSCPWELWPLFLTISLLASVHGPACPSQAGYPFVFPECLPRLVLSPPPSSRRYTQRNPPTRNTCFIVQRWFLTNTSIYLTATKLFCDSDPQPGPVLSLVPSIGRKARVRHRGE